MRYLSLLLGCVCLMQVNAQTQHDEIFKTITDKNYYSFQVINNKIVGYGSHATKIYDKKWNLLEAHDAGQNELQVGSTYASRSFEYVSSTQSYRTTSWTTNQTYYKTDKFGYTILNFTPFFTGEADKFYFLKTVGDVFLSTHNVSLFANNLSGIAGQASSVSNNYVRLITDFQVVDWDGNVLSQTALPYYSNSYTLSYLEIDGLCYVVAGSLGDIYPKSVKKDVDLYSTTKYELSEKAFEPGYSHYFIYEFDKLSNVLTFVKMEKGPAMHVVEIARFDTNGTKLQAPKSGVNIVMFSDGTCKKLVVP